MLRIRDLKRDSAFINKQLVTLSDGSVISKKTVSIIFPKYFKTSNLYSEDGGIYVLGFLMIKIDNTYMTLRVSAMLPIGESITSETMVEAPNGISTECCVLTYSPGENIFETTEIVVNGKLSYNIVYKIQKLGGQIPYFSENDFLTSLDGLPQLNGISIPSYPFLNQYSALCVRDSKDLSKPKRLTNGTTYTNVAFSSILHSVDNSLSLINGNYTDDAFQKALVTTSDRTSGIEEVLRA